MKRILAFTLFSILILTLSILSFGKTEQETELFALLNENHHPELYTSESYYAYQLALNHALGVYENSAATEAQLKEAITQLKAAKTGLVFTQERQKFLTFIDSLEAYLYNNELTLPQELFVELTAVRDEIRTITVKVPLTPEEYSAAESKYSEVIAKAQQVAESLSKDQAQRTDIVFPEESFDDSKNGGNVAELRLMIILVGSVLLIIGIVGAIVYFKPPKFLK